MSEPDTPQAEPAAEQRHCGGAGRECLCSGAGPAMSGIASRLLSELGPSEPVRRHFTQARLEILKGLRALLDERIGELQKQPARGVKVTID